MASQRIDRINSLLREVIADVMVKDVKNPHLPELITVTSVAVTKDLKHGKVMISIIGDDEKKKLEAIAILNQAAGYIAVRASKQVVLRYFPELTFHLDTSLDKQMHIEGLIQKIHKENETRSDHE